MRLKIKYTSTKKFVLNFNGKTLGELTEAVKAFVADTYGETCPEFALSLNGQVALAGSPDTALSELGIVASDMLTVLPGAVSRSSATGGASDGRSRSDEDAGGGAKDGSAITSLPILLAPTTLLEVSDIAKNQDDAGQTLPASLQSLLAHCRPKDAGQLVNILAHITMLECDFKAPNSSGHSTSPAPSQACSCPSSSCTGPCTSPIPSPGWDGPVASLNYQHQSFSSFTCTLVLVSMGDMKQMLISFPGQDVEISTKVNVRDYIADGAKCSPIEGCSLRNVSRLAKHLRNELLVPLQLAAHRILDVPSPRHLAGLPPELLFQVLKRLDARSVLRLACCCKRLQSAATDNAVWILLYKRNFGDYPPSLDGDLASGESLGTQGYWLARYKKKHLEQKARHIGWQDPRHQIDMQSDIIPPPHPRIYPIGPLYPGFPNNPRGPQPVGPYPSVPDPNAPFNPYGDPDSPYYGGDLPNTPPLHYQPPNPLGPLHSGGPRNPFGDPLNPFGDPSFGGLGPGLPGRRNKPWGGPIGGPGFRFI